MRVFKSVHDAHCCVIHGCKYGDKDCPVLLGQERGIECEECEDEAASLQDYFEEVEYIEACMICKNANSCICERCKRS